MDTADANAEKLFALTAEDRARVSDVLWQACSERALHCRACGLAATRHTVVFGEGDRASRLMFVGEGPGADEDEQGRPFVGRAGQLLTQILEAADIDRKDVYITNIVKCRPPDNRVPLPEETSACDVFLQAQIQLIKPAILVLLGASPTKWILKTTAGITKLRGKWYDWRGIAVMPMFHPSYLLRSESKKPGSPKHLSWLDIQEIKKQWDSLKTTGKLEAIDFG